MFVLLHFREMKVWVNSSEVFIVKKKITVIYFWEINSFWKKLDFCAHAFWRNENVSEQIRSVHFEKENYSDTFLRKVRNVWFFKIKIDICIIHFGERMIWWKCLYLIDFRAHIEIIDWTFCTVTLLLIVVDWIIKLQSSYWKYWLNFLTLTK